MRGWCSFHWLKFHTDNSQSCRHGRYCIGMNSSIISYIIIIVLVPLLTGLLTKSASSEKARVEDGAQIFEYGKFAKGFVWAMWIIGGLFLFLMVIMAKPEHRLNNFMGISIIYILNFFLHLEFFRVQIKVYPGMIVTSSPWRKSRSIPWSDVVSFHYSDALQWWVIKTKHYGSIRAHQYLSGTQELIRLMTNRGIAKI